MAQDKIARRELLVIGGSAGSLSVVLHLLPSLSDLGIAVIIVLHRKQTEEDTLIELLSTRSGFQVKEADDKDDVTAGYVYVAPAEYHLLIEKDRTITLDASEKINYSRPSIDVTFESAAEVYGDSMVCLLLSGANADGVKGLIAARRLGAVIAVQDPATAEFPMMPQEAVDKVPVDLLLNQGNVHALLHLLV